ncbi:hypothetical protein [Nocardioides dilutus]
MTTDSSTHDSQAGNASRSTSAGARRLIAAVLGVAILASAATLAYLVSQRSGDAAELQTQREKVMAQARQFILRVNTYGPDLLAEDGTMPEYRELVLEVITDKFAADFEETVPAAEATVAQAGFARRAEVFGAGVSVIDSDSATALVAGSFTNSYPDPDDDTQRVDDLPLPFRVQIELVKVDGKWLVDNFAPVTGETPNETPDETPGDTPSQPPSEEASE